METAAYFLRYIIPAILAFITVLVLAIFNHFVGPVVWAGRLAERMEVLAYSVLTVGPIVFAVSFLIFFYGIELLKEPWPLAKMMFVVGCILAFLVVIVNVLCLPKMR